MMPRSILLLAGCTLLVCQNVSNAQDAVRQSTVKIHTTARYPNPWAPWTKRSPSEMSGSGVVIEGNKILTNAHVVRYASQIYVQGYNSSEKVPAKIVGIAFGIDLALLEVEDAQFCKTHPPVPMQETLPKPKSTVNVYGYPYGGADISITEGIVSRIEFNSYYYSTQGLRIQIDAALNPGNSGGPAILDGKIIGLVFSRIVEAENIGYLIPVEEIRMFLDDIEDGKYDGKPQIFDALQSAENDALRSKLGLKSENKGLVVRRPFRTDSSYPLKQWDLLIRIGNHEIDNTGMVSVSEDQRVTMAYFLSTLSSNGTVPLTIIRDGKEQEIRLPVCIYTNASVLFPYLFDEYPRYFIYGPLVFSNATAESVGSILDSGRWDYTLQYRESPLLMRRFDMKRFDDEELVIITSPMLSHRITKGYDDPYLQVVSHVNDTPVRNLRHLVELVRDCTTPYITFEFADEHRETFVFSRKEIDQATEEILIDNGIRNRCSDDLVGLWNERQ